jgi:pyruvate kinase
MKNNIEKYSHRQMDKTAGFEHTFHRTKIVATVGPACDTYDKLLELVRAGVNVFRLNFSHGDHEDKARIIDYIRQINTTEPYNIALLGDLQGPKLRVGEMQDGGIDVAPGDVLTFTNEKLVGTKERIYVSYPNLHNDVRVGNKIMIDDGKLEVIVRNILRNNDVQVEVLLGGKLSSKKGINLPDTKISLPALTDKDLVDLDFIIDQDLDWVALSFVRSVKDIIILRNKLHERGSKTKIIAKIEKPEALNNIRDIIIESDGIMIARGDLGVELPIEQVPLIQKQLIRKCLHRAKPVIVATQMMESMIDRSKPNRSEITDVANAVLGRYRCGNAERRNRYRHAPGTGCGNHAQDYYGSGAYRLPLQPGRSAAATAPLPFLPERCHLLQRLQPGKRHTCRCAW